MRLWPRREQRSLVSISDPALAAFFQVGDPGVTGVSVNEFSALGLSSVWRAVSLVSGSIAALPLRTLRDRDGGTRERVPSLFDDPGAECVPALTRFEWLETVVAHLLLHGNAFLAHIYNGAGSLAGLQPIHPLAVSVDQLPTGEVQYRVTLTAPAEVRTFTPDTMTHIKGLSLDGIRGLSPITIARLSLSTAIAGDKAAARMFSNGALITGLVTPEDNLTEEEAQTIKDGLSRKVQGMANAGDIAVINRRLKFTPWTMTHEDAQFMQSRQFQIEEIARWYGVPPHLLMQTEKQTSWGTGVEEQNRAMAKTVLAPWASRIEQRLSWLLPRPRFVEFDFAGLERPDPAQEAALLIQMVQSGLMTPNEARHIRNMDPVDGGDELRVPAAQAEQQAAEIEAEEPVEGAA